MKTRWGDLLPRLLSALVMVPLAIGCAWIGGWIWAILLAMLAVLLIREWRQLCPRWAPGAAYIVLAVVCLGLLRSASGTGMDDVLFLFLIIWASDIFAYLLGRLIGGPKLAPAISPGKTRSGALAGLIAAMLVAEGAVALYGGHPARAASIALILALAGQAGDLFESWIKRRAGVKDSGQLIPGHGGLLDRLDALLAAAPLAALIAWGLGRGVRLWQ